jgi:hypothetical protein
MCYHSLKECSTYGETALPLSSNEIFHQRVSLQRDLTSRDKAIAAWVQTASGMREVPYDRPYDADVAYGHCLVGMDGCRMHLDWYINTLPFSPIPERYNEDVNLMIELLDQCERTVIQAEIELAQIEAAIQKHLHPAPEASKSHLSGLFSRFMVRPGARHRFPFLPLQFKSAGQRLPEILVNYHYVHAAGRGFSGPVTFWYHEQERAAMPVAFGTPGQRLAIIMPAS